MRKRQKYLMALALLAYFTAAVECLAFQDNQPVKPKPFYPRQTAKIISILPFNGITLSSEAVLSKPLSGGEAPVSKGKLETTKMLGLSACISFIGTAFFLMLYMRRRNDVPAVIAGVSERDVTSLNRNDWAQEEMEDQRMRESIGTIIKGEAANIAQHFHRNREEFHLAMKFQQHKNVDHMVKKMGQMKRHSAANTIVVAKQMGFGRGEVELAMHLHEIQQSTT